MTNNNPFEQVPPTESALLKNERKVLQTKIATLKRIRFYEDLSQRNQDNHATFFTSSPVVAATTAAAVLSLFTFGIWLAVPAAVITWYSLPYRRWLDVAYSSIEKYRAFDQEEYERFKQGLAALSEGGSGNEEAEWNLVRHWARVESVRVSRRITEINERFEALYPRLQFFGIRKSEAKARLINSLSDPKLPGEEISDVPKPPEEKQAPKIKFLFPPIDKNKKHDQD